MTDKKLFDVPNLDDLSIDPQDLRDAQDVLALAYEYAEQKASAMELRMEGDVATASLFEQRAEEIYFKLPKRARW